MTGAKRIRQGLAYIILVFLAFVFLAPIFIIVMNSFKGNFYISDAPFTLPRGETFAGFDNFVKGFTQSDFMRSFGNSAFITVFAVAGIVLLTSMTAWYIVRVKNKLTSALYYLFIFSMIVPFQMVMYTMTYFAFELRLNNPIGIVFIYLGFGAGLSVFMFCGFIKSIPNEIEEAAIIQDIPWTKRMFRIIIPIQKSAIISGYMLPFMTCLRELSLFLLLCTQGFILSTTLDYFDEMGLYAFSSAINLILIVTILIFNTLVNKLTGASLDDGIGGN